MKKKSGGENESGGKKKVGVKKNVGKEISLKIRIKRIFPIFICADKQTNRETDRRTDGQTPSIVW